MSEVISCPCLNAKANRHSDVLNQFEELRKNCVALRKILLPDDVWPVFKESISGEFDEARHFSILLSAFKDNCLYKITSPIHKYLLDNQRVKGSIKKGYLQDIKENWIKARNFLRRQQRLREYYGKVIELLIAEWLENQGWNIANLEATCGNSDIEASSPENIPHCIEVKYIGTSDDVFLATVSTGLTKDMFSYLSENIIAQEIDELNRKKIIKSFEKAIHRDLDPFCGANYLLYRTYEAAKQLQKVNNHLKYNNVIVVISNIAWAHLQIAIDDNFIDWQGPSFLDKCHEWDDFLLKEKKKYPDIDKDLQSTIHSLNQLWIIQEKSYFNFSLQCIVNFGIKANN